MSSPSEPEQRYPKRRRTAVAYIETVNIQDEFDQDSEIIVKDNNPAIKDEARDSDKDEDWTLKPNHKKRTKKPRVKKPKTKKAKPFPFMELPPELREAVYKLVVGSPDGIISIEPSSLTNLRLRRTLDESFKPISGGWSNWAGRKKFRNLRLLRVSKTVYAEAAVVMYTQQKFYFSRLSALQTFLLLLRPETLDRLIHVQVDVGETEWTFMPGVASQLLQLHYLQTLKITGLGVNTSSRNFSKYLTSTGRSESTWAVTMESYDKMKGIKLARDMYPFMYPFFNAVIRAGFVEAEGSSPHEFKEPESEPASSAVSQSSMTKYPDPTPVQNSITSTDEEQKSPYKPLVGVDVLVETLELEESRQPYGGWFHHGLQSPSFDQFKSSPMTDQRQSTRRTAMKEELLMLMGKDSF